MMRLSEIYQSVQGEGPRVGEPTTFVRFGGCNLRCPGWPCDSYFSVLPERHAEWEITDPLAILSRIPQEPRNVCLTGGEPFVQPDICMKELCITLTERDLDHHVEIFTNGSRYIPNWMENRTAALTLVVDWKMPGSGEFGTFREENLERMNINDSIKFVITDSIDFEIACGMIHKHRLADRFDVFVGVAWGKLPESTLVEWMLADLPCGKVRLNTQIHKYIWEPNERRR
jgi:7-carboxy-7-deazaguanine synthase